MRIFSALLTSSICLTSTSFAQEVLVDCRFEFKPMKAGDLAKSKEKEAMAWVNSLDFAHRAFVLDFAAGKITDGPGPADIYKRPQITITSQTIEIEWEMHASPLDRSPHLWMKVNRFSGVALEAYTMLAGPNRGPRTVYWGRPGECSFHKRKV